MLKSLIKEDIFRGNTSFTSYKEFNEKVPFIISGDIGKFSIIKISSDKDSTIQFYQKIISNLNSKVIDVQLIKKERQSFKINIQDQKIMDIDDILNERLKLYDDKNEDELYIVLYSHCVNSLKNAILSLLNKLDITKIEKLESLDETEVEELRDYQNTTELCDLSNGNMIIKDRNGNIKTIEPKHGLTIVYGNPGSAKTSFLNKMNLDLCMNNSEELPLIYSIGLYNCMDSGFNSIQTSLKSNYKKYLTQYNIDKNLKEYINIFDTELGIDEPYYHAKCMIKSGILNILLSEKDHFNNDYASIIEIVLEHLYKIKKYYVRGESKYIDEIMNESDIYSKSLSWKTLRNILIEKNNLELAMYCHKKSMPCISDFIGTLYNNKILKGFKYSKHVVDMINKLENFCERYPYFNGCTTIDKIDDAKIKSFNTDEASTEYVSTLLVYSYNKIYSPYFIINENSINGMNINLVNFIKDKFEKMKNNKARIIIDELQRYNNKHFNDLLHIIIRENHKLKNCEIVLSCQMFNDVERLTDFVSSLFLLSTDREIVKKCLPEEYRELDFVKNKKGPRKDMFGNKINDIFCCVNIDNDFKYIPGTYCLGDKEYLFTCASKKETKIMKKLSELFDGNKIREILLSKYPNGINRYGNDNPDIIIKEIIYELS